MMIRKGMTLSLTFATSVLFTCVAVGAESKIRTEAAASEEPLPGDVDASGADKSASAQSPTQVLVTMQLIQIDEPSAGVLLEGGVTIQEGVERVAAVIEAEKIEGSPGGKETPKEEAGKTAPDAIELGTVQPSGANALGFGVHIACRDATLKIGERTVRLQEGRFLPPKGAKERADAAAQKGYDVLAAPRMAVLVGQKAEMRIGATVPYMVRRDDGLFELRYTDEPDEGVSVTLKIESADAEAVSFENVRMRFSTVTSRSPIPDVPLEVGRPVIRAMEISSAMRLAPGVTAILSFPRIEPNAPLILAAISGRVVEMESE